MVNPVAAYSFDEASGTLIIDRTGNGHDFDLSGSSGQLLPSGGHTAGGLGKTDAAGMPEVASPSFIVDGSWSFMFWQQGNGDAVWWVRLTNNTTEDGTGHGILLLGDLQIRIREPGNPIAATVAPTSDGLWHHYAATYDGANGRLYLDGALVATTALATNPVGIDSIEIAEYSNAVMDDLRFFNVELTQEQIEDYMNTPVVDSPTSTGNAFIYNGTDWVATTPQIWSGSAWVPTSMM
jgi:concanavalin A-like lectin/glucanase superfamily protein